VHSTNDAHGQRFCSRGLSQITSIIIQLDRLFYYIPDRVNTSYKHALAIRLQRHIIGHRVGAVQAPQPPHTPHTIRHLPLKHQPVYQRVKRRLPPLLLLHIHEQQVKLVVEKSGVLQDTGNAESRHIAGTELKQLGPLVIASVFAQVNCFVAVEDSCGVCVCELHCHVDTVGVRA